MPCFSTFCCGYGLRSSGSFIGYISIIVYLKLFVISVIFLLNINNRIDESEGNSNASFWSQISSAFRVRSSRNEIENFVGELKSEEKISLRAFINDVVRIFSGNLETLLEIFQDVVQKWENFTIFSAFLNFIINFLRHLL